MTDTETEWFTVLWWRDFNLPRHGGHDNWNINAVHVSELKLFVENRDLDVAVRDPNEFFPPDGWEPGNRVPNGLAGKAAVAPVDTGEFLTWEVVQTIISEKWKGLSDALYDEECGECGRLLEWTLRPDADAPRWTAECKCGRHTLDVSKVKHTYRPSNE